MENMECSATAVCRQYCEALRVQGVPIEFGEDGCNAPSLFEVSAEGVTFNPGTQIENPTLVSTLGGALCDVLARYQEDTGERQEAAKLEALYESQFEAKMNLWNAMLQATREGRQFTDAEREFYETNLTYVDEALADVGEQASPETVLRAQAVFDRSTIERYGLVFDEQITRVVDRLVGNLMDGKPSLEVGDKGIAKTQVAKFVARLWDSDNEPIIISGHGDQMTDEFMGKVVQDKASKTFSFKEGKLVQAMRDGRQVLVDEVNISDQAIVMRLQDILLRRPGEKIVLQENGGEEIEIKPGFVVFATANEASARYQHRTQLDPAFRDRFDVVPVTYPDSDTKPLTEIPRSTMRLVLAAAVNEHGELSPHMPADELETLARLAHATQILYSVPGKDARIPADFKSNQTTSEFLGSDEPVMSDCITPRAMVETVRRCSLGNKPGMNLATETKQLIGALDQAGSTTNKYYADLVLEVLKRGK